MHVEKGWGTMLKTFSLDGSGNLTLHNRSYEGISTDSLPSTP